LLTEASSGLTVLGINSVG